MNPRVVCFLAAHGLAPADIERVDADEVRCVLLDGAMLPWTIHFMAWNSAQWRAWAAELGFTRGSLPEREALLSGHTEDDYDEWLCRRSGVGTPG